MNFKKAVSLGVFLFLLFFIVACGEQSFKKADIRLLNSKKSNESNRDVEIDENESEFIIETNSSDSKVVLNPTIENMDRNNSTTETNESIVALVVKESAKSDKVQLAELEAKLKAETLAMQSKHNISLKKLEADKAKLLKEKEVALAKLESDREIAKVKELNKKELSLLELKSQEKIALAKIKTQKDLSKNEEKVALSRAVTDSDIAIAQLKNQRELADKNISFYKMVVMMVVGLIVLILLIVYSINSKKRKSELKMHENELRHKEYMETTKQQNEHIGKMLDVIIDENADSGIKKEIVQLLREQEEKGNLIEYKK